MGEPVPTADRYLRELTARVAGSRRARERLLTEIRDHLDDAAAAHRNAGMQPRQAEQRALELLGEPVELAEAWDARCALLRRRRRGRAAILIATTAAAALLGAAQHADGHRDPPASQRCSIARGPAPPPHCSRHS
jgi:hypothetical protein